MLPLLVTIMAMLAAPSPAPEASASPAAALTEIGHVEAHPACANIVVRANAAIADALANDSDLALTINRLRTSDLDSDNDLRRRNDFKDLQTLAGRIRMSAFGGTRDVKALRSIDAQTTDPVRKAELKAFSDALGGAIARQRIAATNLDKLLTIIDGERASAEARATMAVDQSTMNATDRSPNARPSMLQATLPTAPPRVDPLLRALADEFEQDTLAIRSDESDAAGHSDGATADC